MIIVRAYDAVLCGSEESCETSESIEENHNETLLRPRLSAVPRDFSVALGRLWPYYVGSIARDTPAKFEIMIARYRARKHARSAAHFLSCDHTLRL